MDLLRYTSVSLLLAAALPAHGAIASQRRPGDLFVLFASCRYDEEKCTPQQVRSFIAEGADPNARNESGSPVLEVAVAAQLPAPTIRILIESGADVATNGGAALIKAAESQSQSAMEVAQLLLDRGADANARNREGWTALILAAYQGTNPEMISALLRGKADVRIAIPTTARSNRPEDWQGGDTALAVAEKTLRRLQASQGSPSDPPALKEARARVLKRAELIVRLLREANAKAHSTSMYESRPPLPFIARDICPGERCNYGEWIAEGNIAVYPLEGDTSTVAFRLRQDEIFEALRGNIHVVNAAILAIRAPKPGNVTLHLDEGDFVFVLYPLGEGRFDVWHQGRVFRVEEFWRVGSTARAVVVRSPSIDPQTEWWINVRNRKGQSGWIRR